MDRDKRWERVQKAYDLLVHGTGASSENAVESIRKKLWKKGITTDEFIEPIVMVAKGKPVKPFPKMMWWYFSTSGPIVDGTYLCYRKKIFPNLAWKLPLYYVTLTNYDDTFQKVKVVYDKGIFTIP